MSTVEHEPALTERVDEPLSVQPRKLREVRVRDLWVRFLAGALTSISAGVITLAFGPRVGGIFLALPATLAASLSLIEQQEDSGEAREDARGAIMGGAAMALFAVVTALELRHLSGAAALALGAIVWLLAAVAGYALVWRRRR
jgi:hypothetical protein